LSLEFINAYKLIPYAAMLITEVYCSSLLFSTCGSRAVSLEASAS